MLKKFVIEREVPGIGKNTAEGFCNIAKASNTALSAVGGDNIQWLESFVMQDGTYCVYLAKDEAAIREHAQKSGFPANRITEVKSIIDPSTARAAV